MDLNNNRSWPQPVISLWDGYYYIIMSSKGASDHKSKQVVSQEAYSKECIDKRLLLQISFEWKLFVLAKGHYSNIVQERLAEKNLPFVSRVDDLLKFVQLRFYGL